MKDMEELSPKCIFNFNFSTLQYKMVHIYENTILYQKKKIRTCCIEQAQSVGLPPNHYSYSIVIKHLQHTE